PSHQLHYKVRPARFGRPRVEHSGNVWMVHHRQGLSLRLEASDDTLGIHPELDDLEGDPASDRFLLFGHIDKPAAAFPDLLQQLVATDAAGFFSRGSCIRPQGGSSLKAVRA